MMMQGPTGRAVWNRLHFYNNFEISRLSFWSPPLARSSFRASFCHPWDMVAVHLHIQIDGLKPIGMV
eukprot:2268571-Rhodomonas_salina.2